ncbi:MAG: hypothetical protein LBB51_00550 [Zoogloeaceae bacterium]|jgi:hypothetical protein|nr:hypothetical protein [Zoogloeaceae bacterium]
MNKERGSRPNIRSVLAVLALAALAAIIGAGQFLYRRQPVPETVPLQTPPRPPCDLNLTPCRVPLAGGGEAEVEFMLRPVPLLASFPVRIHLKNQTADQMQMEFIGSSMDMGFNQVKLRQETPGVFVGNATLPVCSAGPMRWRAAFTLIRGQAPREIRESFTLSFATGNAP